MKYILFITLTFILVSCNQDEIITEKKKTNTVTFLLSKIEEGGFTTATPKTRAIDWLDFGKYVVKLYLFGETTNQQNPNTGENRFLLEKIIDVTEPVITIDVTPNKSYKYVFAATTKGQEALLGTKDFGPLNFDNTSHDAVIGTTYMDNCYFQLAATDGFNYSGNATTESRVNQEFYADGYTINTSFDFSTPVGVVLRRQVGMVEFQLANVKDGDAVSCSIPTDYYRLYLTQICKLSVKDNYVSSNSVYPDVNGYTDCSYDYYSYVANYNMGSPYTFSFTRTETLSGVTNSKYNFQIFMPYTTAAAVGSNVSTTEQANYYVTQNSNSTGVKLTINGKSYSYNQPFPIYRDAKTYFMIKGTQLVTNWASGSGGGIDLDDDKWDGITQ